MTNQEAIKQVEQLLDRYGITKAEGNIDLSTVNFGGVMPRQQVEQLISLTRAKGGWLGQLQSFIRQGKAGTVPVTKIGEPVTEGVGEGEQTPITSVPTNWNVPYNCKKFRIDWNVTLEDLREAQVAGIANFEATLSNDFATAMANDKADIIWNSSIALGTATRRDRMLRMIDGVLVKTDTGNVKNCLGKAFTNGIFPAMIDDVLSDYKSDPGMRFLYGQRIENLWRLSLTNVASPTSTRSALGDTIMTSEAVTLPFGKPQTVIPQMSDEGGITPVAPTAVTDNTTTITFRVATLLADATDSTGRRVKVVYKASGKSEVCTVARNGSSQNVITTTTLLGQNPGVSVTVGDYTITTADETQVILGNPKGIVVVDCDQVRSYRVFNPKAERWEITTFYEMDVLVPAPEVFTKYTRVQAPRITW